MMKKRLFEKKGFTLIELVAVIAILGVLAVVALPKLFSISLTQARTNSMNAAVGAIQSGIALYAANQVATGAAATYPTTLDSVTGTTSGVAASNLAPLFVTITQNGVSGQWFKISNTCYAYDTTGNGSYDSTTDTSFRYDSTAGTFLQGAAC